MSDSWTSQLSAYLDGELSGDERAALERHLASCDECSVTLRELQGVVGWARDYEGREPARDVWPRITAAISGTPSGVIKLEERRKPRRRAVFAISQALAASVALALAGAGGWWLARATAPNQMAAVIDIATPGTAASAATTIAAVQKYGPAIADLERVLLQQQDALDSATVRALQQQLAIIDRALEEAQAALARDPSSDFLAEHYSSMMKKKLHVLRGATRRPVRS